MSTPPTAAPTAAEHELEQLLDVGRRLSEELETIQKHAAHLKSEIERHESDLAAANAALDALPKDASAVTVHGAKTVVIAIEMNRGRLQEQLAALQPELDEVPALIQANREAVAGARAELR